MLLYVLDAKKTAKQPVLSSSRCQVLWLGKALPMIFLMAKIFSWMIRASAAMFRGLICPWKGLRWFSPFCNSKNLTNFPIHTAPSIAKGDVPWLVREAVMKESNWFSLVVQETEAGMPVLPLEGLLFSTTNALHRWLLRRISRLTFDRVWEPDLA